MPKTAPSLTVSNQDEQTLRRWTRSSSIRAGLVQRARIVLAAAEGLSNTRIAEQVGCSRPAVIRWRGRYAAKGLAGLQDQPRSGRPRTVRRDRRAEIIAVTRQPPPQRLGITHWSTRSLARHLGVSRMTVARVWAEHDLKPWRMETFTFSTDPELHAKVADLCGLYLDPPAGAVVVCMAIAAPSPLSGAGRCLRRRAGRRGCAGRIGRWTGSHSRCSRTGGRASG
jgi:transposase